MHWFYYLLLIFIIFIIVLLIYIKSIKKKEKNYRAKYPSTYYCNDGHKARSLSEVIIDNCLFDHGIQHKAEDIILQNMEKKYKYDFYLNDCDIYLEFFGYSGKKYHDTRVKKENFYRKNNLKMITIEPADLVRIKDALKDKLGQYWNKIAISKHCPNCGTAMDNRL
jgi:hypothetical protein